MHTDWGWLSALILPLLPVIIQILPAILNWWRPVKQQPERDVPEKQEGRQGPLITAGELARRLNTATAQVWAWYEKGDIPGVSVGRGRRSVRFNEETVRKALATVGQR